MHLQFRAPELNICGLDARWKHDKKWIDAGKIPPKQVVPVVHTAPLNWRESDEKSSNEAFKMTSFGKQSDQIIRRQERKTNMSFLNIMGIYPYFLTEIQILSFQFDF